MSRIVACFCRTGFSHQDRASTSRCGSSGTDQPRRSASRSRCCPGRARRSLVVWRIDRGARGGLPRKGTGSHIFLDDAVAASVTAGSPSDIDAEDGILGVIDRGAGQSHLTLFSYNRFGELTPSGPAITLNVASANGVAIMPPDRN